MPLLQGIRNTAATIKNAIVNAWQGEDHAQAVALGITIGEKIARFAPRGLGYHPSLDQTNENETQRRAYPKMVAEPSIKAALYSKLFAVASLELSVQPAEDDPNGAQTAAFVRHALTSCRGGSRKIIESITLPGLIAGYSLCGKIWKQEDRGKYAGKVVLADLKSYDPNDYWLEIDGYKNIIAVTSRLDNKRYPLTEFAHWAHLPLYENPLGMSDLRAAYRQYTIIGLAWKYWAIVLERYTLPLLKGKYPKDKDTKFQRAIEEAMKNAKANGYISYPDGSDVEALEMALNAGPAFHLAIDDLQKEAFLGITFSYLQALEGNKTGARAMGQVHQSSSELLVWYLADCAAGVLNDQVVPQLVDWNFGAGVPYPKVSFGSVNDADLLPSLQLDQGLMGMGLTLSKKAAYARYNREMPLDETDAIHVSPSMPALPGGPADAQPFRG